MKKRLLAYNLFILLVVTLSFFLISLFVSLTNNKRHASQSVKHYAEIYAKLYHSKIDLPTFVASGNEVRVSVISAKGEMLADSFGFDLKKSDNHLSRLEIQEALDGEPQTEVRQSSTLGQKYMYYSLKVPSDNTYVFIRTAVPIASIHDDVARTVILLLLVFCAIAGVSVIYSRKAVAAVLAPIGQTALNLRSLALGEYKRTTEFSPYPEMNAITTEINEVALAIEQTWGALETEKNKLNNILANISNGIFAVDKMNNVILANRVAMENFETNQTIIGKNVSYLTYNSALLEAISHSLTKKGDDSFELELNARIWNVAVSWLEEAELCLVTMTDVTASRQASKIREEFFANASHELKTPLTAIRGFAELIELKNHDSHLQKYIAGVCRETQRMSELVQDMLKLSELEQSSLASCQEFNLEEVIGDVLQTLEREIENKELQIHASGTELVSAKQFHLFELIKNLLENAIRYNRQDGKVYISVENMGGTVFLHIKDTGIGIPLLEQERIFERFYTVDKGRSRQNGGTGLGLAIVKHIASLYGWQIALQSQIDVGTEITVAFCTDKQR